MTILLDTEIRTRHVPGTCNQSHVGVLSTVTWIYFLVRQYDTLDRVCVHAAPS